ncbi:patatin-like phospholipase-like protein [Xylaria arbuscula]|nr:patatin-like phospholipase-like protein [Xylaria arbuscula]
MNSCKHTSWLRLARTDHHLTLEVSDRVKRLADHHENQCPNLLVLIGGQSKIPALSSLGMSRTLPLSHGKSPNDERYKRPHRPRRSSIQPGCHETRAEVADYLYHRILIPFADIVCLFVDDLGGLEVIARHVAAWISNGKPSTTFIPPWLVLVVKSQSEQDILAAFRRSIRAKTSCNLHEHFRGVRVISVTMQIPGTRSRMRRQDASWQRFSSQIPTLLEEMSRSRRASRLSFSAHHLAELLERAVQQATCTAWSPVDPVHASRMMNPVSDELEMHLGNFLQTIRSVDAIQTFAVPVIASSFLLDNYPPGMHFFDPKDVLRLLYQTTCYTVCRSCVLKDEQLLLPSRFTHLVEKEMVLQFGRMQCLESSVASHRELLARYQEQLAVLHLAHTCLGCLRRTPEFALPCGHVICENCVRVFGRRDETEPWAIYLENCILCGADTSQVCIRVKPDTSGVRVLSIDGGGTRGRVPLEFLQVLQDELKLPYPVQRHFDLVYGTSSGAIITCALYMNGWPVEECVSAFEKFAHIAFKPKKPWISVPVLSKLCEMFRSIFTDSRYSNIDLKMVLQKVLGTGSLIDYSRASEFGVKVGIPVATPQDAEAYVFTNYNRVGNKIESTGNYLPPWHIHGLGTFIDGGVIFNNPASIAVREARRVYPTITEPSLVVSLGTGQARKDSSMPLSQTSTSWGSSFVVSMLKAIARSWSSQRAWQQLISHQKAEINSDFFRFDIEFPGSAPSLDNLSYMQDAAELARRTILQSPDLSKVVHKIRAQLLLFELDPVVPFLLRAGSYECTGRITCRLRAGSAEYKTFMSQLHQQKAVFLVENYTIPVALESGIGSAGVIVSQTIQFQTRSRLAPITIGLREGTEEAYNISGSPFSLQWLLHVQGLETSFGTADHRKRPADTGSGKEHRPKRRRL